MVSFSKKTFSMKKWLSIPQKDKENKINSELKELLKNNGWKK